jgi:hypothetical protein
MYLRTLKALQELQAAAASQPAEQPAQPAEEPPQFVDQSPDTPLSEPASSVATQPLKPQIGFVPPNTPASGERLHLSQVRLLTPSTAIDSPRPGASVLKSFCRP